MMLSTAHPEKHREIIQGVTARARLPRSLRRSKSVKSSVKWMLWTCWYKCNPNHPYKLEKTQRKAFANPLRYLGSSRGHRRSLQEDPRTRNPGISWLLKCQRNSHGQRACLRRQVRQYPLRIQAEISGMQADPGKIHRACPHGCRVCLARTAPSPSTATVPGPR